MAQAHNDVQTDVKSIYQLFDNVPSLQRLMGKRMVTSFGLVLLMLTAGCIGNVRDEIITELPEDWRTKTNRTISQPHLVQFETCFDMEYD